jgi:hypothetical protein
VSTLPEPRKASRLGRWIIDRLAMATWDADRIVRDGDDDPEGFYDATKAAGRWSGDVRDQRRVAWLTLRFFFEPRRNRSASTGNEAP